MLNIKVIFADGNYLYTRMNATEQEAREYYIGKTFNVGTVTDNMQRCISIEITGRS